MRSNNAHIGTRGGAPARLALPMMPTNTFNHADQLPGPMLDLPGTHKYYFSAKLIRFIITLIPILHFRTGVIFTII